MTRFADAHDHRDFMPGVKCPACGRKSVRGADYARECYDCGHTWEEESKVERDDDVETEG